MKRLIAGFLRHRSAWQLVLIAALGTSAALLITYNVYSSTLRQIQGLLMLLYGVAGAALILAFVRRDEEIKQSGGTRRWSILLLGIVALAGLIAFTTYSLGHYGRDMIAAYNAAKLPDTLAERQAAMDRAEAGLRSPFALLPRLFDDMAARECAVSRRDLDRVDRGQCARWPIAGLACTCGAETYPYSRCPTPNCLYAPGLPDLFDCPGDPVREGYYGPP